MKWHLTSLIQGAFVSSVAVERSIDPGRCAVQMRHLLAPHFSNLWDERNHWMKREKDISHENVSSTLSTETDPLLNSRDTGLHLIRPAKASFLGMLGRNASYVTAQINLRPMGKRPAKRRSCWRNSVEQLVTCCPHRGGRARMSAETHLYKTDEGNPIVRLEDCLQQTLCGLWITHNATVVSVGLHDKIL